MAEGVLELVWNVLLLRIAKRPNLVALHPARAQVGEHGVLVFGTSCAEVDQDLRDGVLGHAGHPHDGADAHAFAEQADDLASAFGAQPVHSDHYA